MLFLRLFYPERLLLKFSVVSVYDLSTRKQSYWQLKMRFGNLLKKILLKKGALNLFPQFSLFANIRFNLFDRVPLATRPAFRNFKILQKSHFVKFLADFRLLLTIADLKQHQLGLLVLFLTTLFH